MIRLLLSYSSKLYTPESLLLAAQELKEYGSVILKEGGDDLLVEALVTENVSGEEFTARFNRAVSDYQLRVIIGEKTSSIREMIVAQAFAPCDNLEEIVGAYEKNAHG